MFRLGSRCKGQSTYQSYLLENQTLWFTLVPKKRNPCDLWEEIPGAPGIQVIDIFQPPGIGMQVYDIAVEPVCDRPLKRSASEAPPSSVSNLYSLSIRTQGSC